ncbi:MAG: hypothetical protein ACLTDF_11060 [Coprococcus sp.]
MIRRLEDLTGLDATKIRLDDKDVMELFHSTKSLGITPEDINGIPLGSLGVPEFGTDFAMQMLIDAKPTCFFRPCTNSGSGTWNRCVAGQCTGAHQVGQVYYIDSHLLS